MATSERNCAGGCLLVLVGGWFALWVLVRIIELCHRMPVLSDIADGFVFSIGFAVYVVVLFFSYVVEGVRIVIS